MEYLTQTFRGPRLIHLSVLMRTGGRGELLTMKTPLSPPTSRNLYQYSGKSVKRKFELETDNVSASWRLNEWVEILMECIELGAWIDSVERNGLKSGVNDDELMETSCWQAP